MNRFFYTHKNSWLSDILKRCWISGLLLMLASIILSGCLDSSISKKNNPINFDQSNKDSTDTRLAAINQEPYYSDINPDEFLFGSNLSIATNSSEGLKGVINSYSRYRTRIKNSLQLMSDGGQRSVATTLWFGTNLPADYNGMIVNIIESNPPTKMSYQQKENIKQYLSDLKELGMKNLIIRLAPSAGLENISADITDRNFSSKLNLFRPYLLEALSLFESHAGGINIMYDICSGCAGLYGQDSYRRMSMAITGILQEASTDNSIEDRILGSSIKASYDCRIGDNNTDCVFKRVVNYLEANDTAERLILNFYPKADSIIEGQFPIELRSVHKALLEKNKADMPILILESYANNKLLAKQIALAARELGLNLQGFLVWPIKSTSAHDAVVKAPSSALNAFFSPDIIVDSEVLKVLKRKYFNGFADAISCPAGQFSTLLNEAGCQACTNKPANALKVTYTTAKGNLWNNCAYASITCSSGYTKSGNTCIKESSGCAAGKYLSGGSCIDVGKGYFSPANNNNRTACAGGMYSDIINAASCKACTNRPVNASSVTYTAATGTQSNNCAYATITCLSGYTKSGNTCIKESTGCAAGKHLLNGSCVDVGRGYYSPANNNNRTACAGGMYSDIVNAASCKSCTNKPANASSVTYTAATGTKSNNCAYATITCLSGYTQSGSTCIIVSSGCAAGKYLSNGSCIDVGRGYFSPANNNNRTACAGGMYSDIVNAASCNSCTNKPANALSVTYTAATGTQSNNCAYATITCSSGYTQSGNTCVLITSNPPTATLNASPNSILIGESSTLTWSSTGSTSCSGSNFNTNNQISGTLRLSPTANTTYSITCRNASGLTDTKSVVVSVSSGGASYPVVPGKYSTLLKNFADTAMRDGRDKYGSVKSDVFVDGLTVAAPHTPVLWEIDDAYYQDTGYPKQSYLCNAVSFTPFATLLRELTKITGLKQYEEASRSALSTILKTQVHANGLGFWGSHSVWDCLNDEYTGLTSSTSGNKPLPMHEMKNPGLNYRSMYAVNPAVMDVYMQQLWNASMGNQEKSWTVLDYTRHATFGAQKKLAFGKDAPTTVDKIIRNTALPLESDKSKFFSVQSELLLAAFMHNHLTGSQKAWEAGDALNQFHMKMRHPITKLGPPRFAYKPEHTGQQKIVNTEQLIGFGDNTGRYLAGIHVLLTMAELSSGEKKEYFLKYANEELTAWADHKHIAGTGKYKHAVYLDGTRATSTNASYVGDGYIMFYNYARAFRMTGNAKYWNMAKDIFSGYGQGTLGKTASDSPNLDFTKPYTVVDIQYEYLSRYDGFIIHGLLELYRATGNRKYLELSAKLADNIAAQLFKNNLPLFVPNAKYSRLGELWPLALADLEAAIQGKRLEPDSISSRADMIFHSMHKTLKDSQDGTKRIRDNMLYMLTP